MTEEESFNGAAYGVEKKAEGKNFLLRRLVLVGMLAFSVGYILLFTVVLTMPVVIAILPVIWLIFYPFFMRFFTYDCEYRLEHGELFFERLYKNKKRKKLFSVVLKETERIAPLTGSLADRGYDRILDMRGSVKSPDSYFLTYRKGDKNIAVCFEATQKMVRLMAHYNPRTVVSKELRY